jgi:GPH family glycoside/pentoside/hexuronide:cation symporter
MTAVTLDDAPPAQAAGAAAADAAPPLGFRTKVGYGLGALPAGILLTGLGAGALNYYLNQVVGISPTWTGTLILASLLIDALLDPLIGQWSDNVRTRWGRRHPFMYVGAALMGIAFYALWHAPKTLSGGALAAYMLILLVAVRIANSVHDIPSNSLVPELAPDYDKRTTLISYRWFFLMFGLVGAGVLLNAVFLRTGGQNKEGLLYGLGYARFGAVAALLIFLSAVASAFSTQGRIKYLYLPPREGFAPAKFFRELSQALTHPALIVLMLCAVFGGVAYGFRTALDNYFYTHMWGLKPQQIAGVNAIGALGAVVAVIIAPILSKALGKKMTMIVLFTTSTVVSLIPMSLKLLGLMPPNSSPWIFPILVVDYMFVLGLSITGYVIISSMVADVAEDNAAKTGARSEGLLFAANGLVSKVTAGMGIFLSNAVLTVVHFPAHARQGTVPWETMRHMALLFLPMYAGLVALSLIVLFFYRIDKATHERNLQTMREAAAAANQAMTGEIEAGATHG